MGKRHKIDFRFGAGNRRSHRSSGACHRTPSGATWSRFCHCLLAAFSLSLAETRLICVVELDFGVDDAGARDESLFTFDVYPGGL